MLLGGVFREDHDKISSVQLKNFLNLKSFLESFWEPFYDPNGDSDVGDPLMQAT